MEYNQLPVPVSASEALKPADISIEVPARASETFGPFERKYARGFRIAALTSFRDLQLLGLVHRELREEHAIQAVRADERECRDARVRSAPRHHGDESGSCSCTTAVPRIGNASRRDFQNHLIELLEPMIGGVLTAIHPVVIHTFHHVSAWARRPSQYLLGLVALENITIGDHATLTGSPTVSALYANNITIGVEGRLSFASGAVKVRCKELTGPPSPVSRLALAGLSAEFKRRVA